MGMYDFPREGIGIKELFSEYVRENVEKLIKETPTSGMDGTEITLQFKITGATEYKYCLKVIDGNKLDIFEGGIPNPVLEVEISEADWRDGMSLASELGELLIDQMMYASRFQVVFRRNYDILKKIRGKIEVEVVRPGQPSAKSITRFNQAETPAVTVVMSQEDLMAIAKRETRPQVAFMAGKVKVKGDISLLVKLAALGSVPMKGGGKK